MQVVIVMDIREGADEDLEILAFHLELMLDDIDWWQS